MTPKEQHEHSQAMEDLIRTIPNMLFRLHKQFQEEGFTSQESLVLVVAYLKTVFNPHNRET